MKFTSASGLLACAGLASAFPAEVFEKVKQDPELAKRAADMMEVYKRQDDSSADDAARIFEPIPMFNKQTQYIDISPGSGHEFVAPGPNDQRGPCPGLNAFANHGFLPHNGYATIQQFFDATTSVVGMGTGLASFLAVYGAAIDGSGTAWSIGGTPLKQGKAGGNGITNSHNKYESDASPMRPDLYQDGNDYYVKINQFQQLINLSPQPSNIDIPTLTKFRKLRFDHQKATNPYFFNGPFTGVAVQPAAYTFIYRFMANHSAKNTEGLLNRAVIKSWFSITGPDGSFKWNPGHEKIPNNWYRRPQAYPYDQDYFIGDLTNAAKLYPEFLDVGGNTGTPNSFVGVDIANLTGGLFNAQQLKQGNNAGCLAYMFANNARPDVVDNAGLTNLLTTISTNAGALGCPQLLKADAKQLKMFPGYTRSGSPFG